MEEKPTQGPLKTETASLAWECSVLTASSRHPVVLALSKTGPEPDKPVV